MKQYVLMSNEELGELEHFGVRGMKWGVRKQKITKGARRFGRQAVRAGNKGLRTAKRYGNKGLRTAKRYGNKGLRKVNSTKNKVVKKWNKLSPTKKKVIVGTAVTALIAAAAYSGGKAITMRGIEKAFSNRYFGTRDGGNIKTEGALYLSRGFSSNYAGLTNDLSGNPYPQGYRLRRK